MKLLLMLLFTVVELNCENLFDCQDDPGKQDEEFLPEGSHHWTHGRYWTHQNNVGKTILASPPTPLPSGEGSEWSIPDLVCLCEVENDTVMRDLTERSCLRNAGYKYLMTDSPDLRGIDVALLYNPFTFQPQKHRSIRVQMPGGVRPTRDILYVEGKVASGNKLHVFVVHAPSQNGGEYETRQNRRQVLRRLAEAVDSVLSKDMNSNIIIAGDFNDHNPLQLLDPLELMKTTIVDASLQAKGQNGAEGTYKFRGEWGSLDHIFVNNRLQSKVEKCFVNDAEFLLEEDKDYGGVKPKRNFQGPVYRKGFSDHLPLVLVVKDL